MKLVLLFLFFTLIGIVSFFAFKKYTVTQQTITVLQTPLAKTSPYSLDTPPKKSLRGNIENLSGDVSWQSRSASEPAVLTKAQEILQGEDYWTGEEGSLSILFPHALTIIVSPNTHIAILQTLPKHIVLSQTGGEVLYKKLSQTIPVAVRANSLLIQQKNGDMTISFDKIDPITTIRVSKGLATVAFNNTDVISNVVEIPEGNMYVFNSEELVGELTTIE